MSAGRFGASMLLLICFLLGGGGSSTQIFCPQYVFELYLKGLPIFICIETPPTGHVIKGEIFSFPIPPFIKEKQNKTKKPIITTNNAREADEAIPFRGGGAAWLQETAAGDGCSLCRPDAFLSHHVITVGPGMQSISAMVILP